MLVVASLAHAQADTSAIKATFLYRFAAFVAWPAPSDAPLTICVMGSDGFRAALARATAGQSVGTRTLAVRSLTDPQSVRSCGIAYLAGDDDSVRQALRAASGAPVLTVTDADATPTQRGVIHFVVVDDHVRFLIDDARAGESHLSIDSRLLGLAVSVRRRATP